MRVGDHARSDLGKLTQSSSSAINHFYADTISGAIAGLYWSPAAGMSIGRGKDLWASCRQRELCGLQIGVQWGGRAAGAGGRPM